MCNFEICFKDKFNGGIIWMMMAIMPDFETIASFFSRHDVDIKNEESTCDLTLPYWFANNGKKEHLLFCSVSEFDIENLDMCLEYLRGLTGEQPNLTDLLQIVKEYTDFQSWRNNLKTNITFTGVDEWTDLDRLERIQAKYPTVEFGVLFSTSLQGKNPRYPDKASFFDELSKRKLRLSVHVCGRMARDIWTGKSVFPEWAKNNKQFTRCQLNVSGCRFPETDEGIKITLPTNIQEVIVQRKPQDALTPFWMSLTNPAEIAVLIDGSGGKGVESSFGTIAYADDVLHIGFAGGINVENFQKKWDLACELAPHGYFWVDMESGVRTNDKFDLDKVEQILKIYEKNIE